MVVSKCVWGPYPGLSIKTKWDRAGVRPGTEPERKAFSCNQFWIFLKKERNSRKKWSRTTQKQRQPPGFYQLGINFSLSSSEWPWINSTPSISTLTQNLLRPFAPNSNSGLHFHLVLPSSVSLHFFNGRWVACCSSSISSIHLKLQNA